MDNELAPFRSPRGRAISFGGTSRPSPLAVMNGRASDVGYGVMYGRRPRCKRNLTISEAFGCGHVFGLLSLGGLPLSRCSRHGRWP